MFTAQALVRLGFVVIAAIIGPRGVASPAAAQDSPIRAAAITTCNIRGTAKLTVNGAITVIPLTCANQTRRTAPGIDKKASTETTAVSIPAIADLANISDLYGQSSWTTPPHDGSNTNSTVLEGRSVASSLTFLQGGIQVNATAGSSRCSSVSGNSLLSCSFDMKAESLSIDGQPWPLPSTVPLDYPVALENIPLRIDVEGRAVDMLVSGQLTLNKVSINGQNSSELSITQTPIELKVAGATTISGIGAVEVRLDVENSNEMSVSSAYAMMAQTQDSPGGAAVWCVAKHNKSTSELQKVLDFACGSVDCSPILQDGACFFPNTVVAHASYALNSYFQNHGQDRKSCHFDGVGKITEKDPSEGKCIYPH